MSDLEAVLAKLNQLAEEVRELKNRSGLMPTRDAAQAQTAFMSIAEQIRAYIQSLENTDSEHYICHSILSGTGTAAVQVTWLGALQEDDSYSTAKYCLALANEHRIRILKALAGEEKTASQLTGGTGLEGGPLYHHLKELLTARFIQQKERNCYQITPEGLDALLTVCALNRRNTWGKGEVWKGEEDEH